MRPIAPRIPDLEEITVGEEQAAYKPITIARRPVEGDPGVDEIITRWTFTPEERTRIAAGADIFVLQLSTGPMTPLFVTLAEERS